MHCFFRRARADIPVVSGGIGPKFEHIQAFMHVLVTCKNEEDPVKMKALEWPQHISISTKGLFCADPQFKCSPCLGTTWPIDGRTVTEVKVEDEKLETVPEFCFPEDVLFAGGGSE